MKKTSEEPLGERLITVPELAKKLGYSVRRVRKYAANGGLPVVRLNNRDMRFHWPTVLSHITHAPLE
jgi:hypothetical protein